MKSSFLGTKVDSSRLNAEAQSLFDELFPLARSITGEANRKTLQRLSEVVPLSIHEIPSGTKVFDWRVPDEWNVEEAWLKTEDGEVLADFSESNISLVSYSEPVEGTFSLEELEGRLNSLPELPNAIPYRTSYYKRSWGFCLPHSVRQRLSPETKLHVRIDSSLNPQGSLSLADAVSKGESDKEILLSSYCCHPSLANDNLSGVILSTLLFSLLASRNTFYSYRLVIAPETIGPIAYLAQFPEVAEKIFCGAVATCNAGPGPLSFKTSYFENHAADRLARQAISACADDWIEYPFFPAGSDERQFTSPGFRIPMLSFCKDKYYEFPEYHTSLDNLEFVSSASLLEALEVYLNWIELLESNRSYRRTEPHCEYQLGRRGLYPELGGARYQLENTPSEDELEIIERLLFELDGERSLLEISESSQIPLPSLASMCKLLRSKEMIEVVA